MCRLAQILLLIVVVVVASSVYAQNITLSLNVTSANAISAPTITCNLTVSTASAVTTPDIVQSTTASTAVVSAKPRIYSVASARAVVVPAKPQVTSSVQAAHATAYAAGNISIIAVEIPEHVYAWRNTTMKIAVWGLAPVCTTAIIRVANVCKIKILTLPTGFVPRVVALVPWASCSARYVGLVREAPVFEISIWYKNWTGPERFRIRLEGVNFCYEDIIGNITSTSEIRLPFHNKTYIVSAEAPREVRPGEKIRFTVRVVFANTTVPAYREAIFCNASFVGLTDVNGVVMFEIPAPLVPGRYRYVITGAHAVNTYVITVTVKAVPHVRIPLQLIIYAVVAFVIVLLTSALVAVYLRRRRAEHAAPIFVSLVR